VEYEEKDVQQDTQARKELMERGIMAVPVIAVGDEFIVGFDRARLEQKLS
jgi:glutaredoxin 3